MSEYDYLEDLTYRVDLSKSYVDCGLDFDTPKWAVVESLIESGILVQVVPKQRTWRTLFGLTEWIGKKIGIR